MLLSLLLPHTSEGLGRARIDAVYPAAGDTLEAGARLFDFTVGLDAASEFDCPPVTSYRMILREAARVRRLDAEPGQMLAAGAVLGLLVSGDGAGQDVGEGEEPQRGARVSVAAILRSLDW